MSAHSTVLFLDVFDSLDDPRSQRNQLHSMSEILLVCVSALLCGAQGWQDVEDFGKAQAHVMRHYFSFDNGIPSDDTFRRFFRGLNTDNFSKLFRVWVQSLSQSIRGEIIAIDGKSSRRSFDTNEPMLHMISAYATEQRLVLAQEKVSSKSNEITAIPKLLEWLELKGNTVTIDAMGCQHKIANTICKQGGDYIFALKGNQGTLKDDVSLYMDDPTTQQNFDNHHDTDKGHGPIVVLPNI